jgi:uncharacterized iron-regulated membrane protein
MRRHWVWLHRWVGLAMTVFLVIVGLTGSLLAFFAELNRAITPELFPPERAGLPLDMATLAERAEALAPQARTNGVYVGEPGTVVVRMVPRTGNTGTTPSAKPFNQLFLDPVSGAELGRRYTAMGLPTGWDNVMPFVYRLHYNLSLAEFGKWVLGITALLWTIDCFVSIYLTLPSMRRKRETGPSQPRRSFWNRWKPSWLVKWHSSAYRINFDLHRAGGLWAWLALLIFAWSSVYMNLHDEVYAPATRLVLDYPTRYGEGPELTKPMAEPKLSWRQATEIGNRHWAEQSHLHSFTVEAPIGLRLDRSRGIYIHTVRSSRDIQERRGRTLIAFDADTGELKHLQLPTGQHNGLTITMWLNALHDANVAILGLPYRIFVCILGLVITMLSVTGVYIWWKKRRARAKQIARLATQTS